MEMNNKDKMYKFSLEEFKTVLSELYHGNFVDKVACAPAEKDDGGVFLKLYNGKKQVSIFVSMTYEQAKKFLKEIKRFTDV